MKKRVGVAILGLGVVGGGTYRTLVDHREFNLKTQNVDIVVESVLDKNTARLKELGVPQECIAGSIAEGFYEVPDKLRKECMRRLPDDLKEILKRTESDIKRGY